MLEPVLPASPAPGACSPCLACLGDQKGLEVCLKMKPLWASVFMMLAMFLQSSAEREHRGAGLKPRSDQELLDQAPSSMLGPCSSRHSPSIHTSTGTLSQVPCSGVGQVQGPQLPSTGHLHPSMAPCCTGMDPCPGPRGLALPRLQVDTSLGSPGWCLPHSLWGAGRFGRHHSCKTDP